MAWCLSHDPNRGCGCAFLAHPQVDIAPSSRKAGGTAVKRRQPTASPLVLSHYCIQILPIYSDSPAPDTDVPFARSVPVAPANSPVPPTIRCRSMISPVLSGSELKAPAFLIIKSPSLPPTRAWITLSDVNSRMPVVGESAVCMMLVAVPLNAPFIIPLYSPAMHRPTGDEQFSCTACST